MSGLAHALSYSFVLSPVVFLVIALVGIVAALRWRRSGLAVAFVALLALAALATPLAASRLMEAVESGLPAAESGAGGAGAIVLLGGDEQPAETAKADAPGLLSLERIYLAAREVRATHLPILVAGGTGTADKPAVGDLMADVLERDFGIVAKWRETHSTNTYEDAAQSAEILRREGISVVIVVTQRWHMPRAIWAFRHFGITALPAPAPANRRLPEGWLAPWMPSLSALNDSYYAIHEMLGLVLYRLGQA